MVENLKEKVFVNFFSLGVGLLRFGSFFAMARADFVVQLHLDLDTYNDLDAASTFCGHWPWKVLSAASGHGKSLSLRSKHGLV